MATGDTGPRLVSQQGDILPVVPASDMAEIEGVHPHLQLYLVNLGRIHVALFGCSLVLVSGRDLVFGDAPLHQKGRAVAVRIVDLEDKFQSLFLHVLSATCLEWQCCVQDRRAGAGPPHVDIEYYGE